MIGPVALRRIGTPRALAAWGRRGVLGPELVPNGNFDDATGWALQAGWTISGGVAVATAAAIGTSIARSIPTVVGRTYRMRLTCVSRTTNNFSLVFFGNGAFRSAVGTYEEDFVATVTSTPVGIGPRTGALTATFDGISLREVLSP